MNNNSKIIIPFAKEINQNLNTDAIKKNWEKTDHWWLFTKMAQEINAMDRAMMDKKSRKEIDKKAASIASFALIIAKRYGNQR